jgi:hypothetical protein
VWWGKKRGGRSVGWALYILGPAPKLQKSGDWNYCRRWQYSRAKGSSLTIRRCVPGKEVALSKFGARGGGRTETNVYGYPTKPSKPPPGRDQVGYDEIALVELYNFA